MVRLKAAVILALLGAAGCGYTTKTLLPGNIRSVHVAPVESKIDLAAEISDKDEFRVYRPGVEVEVTNAIINRFIFDGNLQVREASVADALVEAKLTDYRRSPLRYSKGDDVQEYRLSVHLDVQMIQASDKKVLWHERNLVGDTTFFIAGPRAESEDEAAQKAVEDAARRIVDKTVEVW
jgi:hypothetical protein